MIWVGENTCGLSREMVSAVATPFVIFCTHWSAHVEFEALVVTF